METVRSPLVFEVGVEAGSFGFDDFNEFLLDLRYGKGCTFSVCGALMAMVLLVVNWKEVSQPNVRTILVVNIKKDDKKAIMVIFYYCVDNNIFTMFI